MGMYNIITHFFLLCLLLFFGGQHFICWHLGYSWDFVTEGRLWSICCIQAHGVSMSVVSMRLWITTGSRVETYTQAVGFCLTLPVVVTLKVTSGTAVRFCHSRVMRPASCFPGYRSPSWAGNNLKNPGAAKHVYTRGVRSPTKQFSDRLHSAQPLKRHPLCSLFAPCTASKQYLLVPWPLHKALALL